VADCIVGCGGCAWFLFLPFLVGDGDWLNGLVGAIGYSGQHIGFMTRMFG